MLLRSGKHKRNHITQGFNRNTFKDLNTLEVLLSLKTFLGKITYDQLASSLNSLAKNFLALSFRIQAHNESRKILKFSQFFL